MKRINLNKINRLSNFLNQIKSRMTINIRNFLKIISIRLNCVYGNSYSYFYIIFELMSMKLKLFKNQTK